MVDAVTFLMQGGTCVIFALIALVGIAVSVIAFDPHGHKMRKILGKHDDPDFVTCEEGTLFHTEKGDIEVIAVRRLRTREAGPWKLWTLLLIEPNGNRKRIEIDATPFENIQCLKYGWFNFTVRADPQRQLNEALAGINTLQTRLREAREKDRKNTREWHNLMKEDATFWKKIKEDIGGVVMMNPNALAARIEGMGKGGAAESSE